MKKMFFLFCVLLITLVPNVYAYNGNRIQPNGMVVTDDVIDIIQGMLNCARMQPEEYGFFDVDFSSLCLGTKMSTYRNNERIHDIHYYPIFENDRIVAITTVYIDPTGNPHISMGVDFALKLNEFTKKHKAFALSFEDDDLFAISQTEKCLLHSFPNSSSKNRKTLHNKKHIIKYTSTAPFAKLSVNQISIQSSSSKYLSVPIKTQRRDENLCWAACVASIGQYRTNIDKTPLQVCLDAGKHFWEGGNEFESSAALMNQYGWKWGGNSAYSCAPSHQTILASINNCKPIWTGFSKDGWYGHAVLFRGYFISSSSPFLTVSFMDPNYSYFRQLASSNNQYYLVYGSIVIWCDAYLHLWF